MNINGNCLDEMKKLKENSVDSIVTDPPYGLKFMGKSWDYDVPSIEIWKEAIRVLKPGGHLLSFGGTRTYHRLVVAIEDAGFEIRDCIQWIYGSGFPKSHNIKEGEFKGWGTALKPANEPICVARKPLEKGLTVAENVLKYGTGALNIDGTRIETSDKINSTTNQNIKSNSYKSDNTEKYRDTIYNQHTQGRWPANVIFDENAAQTLDEQSGLLKSGSFKQTGKSANTVQPGGWKTANRNEKDFGPANSGGASRFFYVAKASKRERNAGLDELDLKQKYSLESSKSNSHDCFTNGDKNPCIPQANHHPTVKPIKLMEYLIKLVTQPKGIVLDPFMGSGSTGIAAKKLGFEFIGIELNEEYFNIADKRINAI